MGFVVGGVRDVKEYATGLEVYLKGRCSLLEGLGTNSQSSDHLKLATREFFTAICLSTAVQFTTEGVIPQHFNFVCRSR